MTRLFFTLYMINDLCFVNLDISFLEFRFSKKRTCRILQKRRFLSYCANNGSSIVLAIDYIRGLSPWMALPSTEYYLKDAWMI